MSTPEFIFGSINYYTAMRLAMTDEMPTPSNANPVEQCLENLERQMPPLANLSEAYKRWLHQVGVAA